MPLATAAASIGQTVMARLIASGIQRVGSLIFQKVLRTTKIEAVLKGGGIKNPVLQTAMADFETVIGTRYGKLTTKLDNFLRELERSEVINSMIENALLGRSSAEIERAFSDLHAKILGAEGNAEELYQAIMNSFTVTVTELSKDRTILDAIRLNRVELQGRLTKIDAALQNIAHMTKKETVTFDELGRVDKIY
jgi:hypothetical protein